VVLNSQGKVIVIGAALLVGSSLAGGCVAAGDFLNPAFLSVLGLGAQVANLPGEAPAILLEVENDTDRVVEFRVTWRDGESEIHERTGALGLGDKFAEVLICPIEEMTLGDVSNLDAVGAIARLGGGGSEDPYVEIEAFGVLLQQDINYDCGDSVTFTILPSSATLSGYQVFAFIRRSGAQTGT
jgi:hypothetical protein